MILVLVFFSYEIVYFWMMFGPFWPFLIKGLLGFIWIIFGMQIQVERYVFWRMSHSPVPRNFREVLDLFGFGDGFWF